jgi:O-antigen/teichoic acid export membrane protein
LSNRGKWLSGSAWLLVGNLVSLAASALAGILIARYLGPADFGAFSAIVAGVSLSTVLVTFGLDLHLATTLSQDDQLHAYQEALSTSYLLAIPICCLFALAALRLSDVTLRLATIVAVGEIVIAPMMLARVSLQVKGRHVAMVVSNLIPRAAWVTISVAVVLFKPSHPLFWIMAGRVAIDFLEGLALAKMTGLPLKPKMMRASTVRRRVLSATWPLGISGLTGFAYVRLDQLLLASIRGRIETGLYAAGVRLAELMNIAARVVQTVTLPELTQLWRDGKQVEFKTALRDSMLLTSAPGGLGVVLLVIGNERLGVLIFGSAYRGTGRVITLLAISELAVFLGTVFATAALAVGARKALAIATGVGFVVNLVGNLAFLPSYGAIAAAWASVAGYSAAGLVIAIGPRQVRQNSWNTLIVLGKVSIGVAGATFGANLLGGSLYRDVIVGATLYSVLVVILMPTETLRVARWVRTRLATTRSL